MGKIQESSVTGKEQEPLLRMIKDEQEKTGFVSEEAIVEIAGTLALPIGEVYGVTTFYSFLTIQPLGKHVIRICKSVPCYLQNAEMVIECVQKELGIDPGETTADGRFSFELTNCIGACDQSPTMLVDDEVYGDLTPGKIKEILLSYD